MPFRAATIEGYLQAAHQQFLSDWAQQTTGTTPTDPARIVERFRYNQDFDSIYAMVPSTIAMLLALIPAILMALAVVREKELGSITNLYVTPATRLEFLLGKQLPYVALSMCNFAMLMLLAEYVFHVPIKGSFPTLLLGTVVYVTATTGYGMLISSFTGTQTAALFGTMLLTVLPATQFSGVDDPRVLPHRRGGADGPGVPNDVLSPRQRRHLHEGAWVSRSWRLHRVRGSIRSRVHPTESRPPAETGALGTRMRSLSTIFWLGARSFRSFLHDAVLRARHLGVFLRRIHPGAEQLPGATQRLRRHCR